MPRVAKSHDLALKKGEGAVSKTIRLRFFHLHDRIYDGASEWASGREIQRLWIASARLGGYLPESVMRVYFYEKEGARNLVMTIGRKDLEGARR